MFSPIPFGILIGAFSGTFIGETLFDKTDTKRAFKAASGSLLGLLTSATIKFAVALVYAVLFFMKVWEYNGEFF
ncbi:lysyl-tRNA synthetase [Polaribacter irgensii 23-P]|uniref:Lysyl-tRNA synthetase n=1 Tax=Polaribacter irgensii 23-P TaxID=313594 RepID=A4C2F0_9FLAO|nr:lysyl-tRNA synthetase [Polaribacter irgensii 23-P]